MFVRRPLLWSVSTFGRFSNAASGTLPLHVSSRQHHCCRSISHPQSCRAMVKMLDKMSLIQNQMTVAGTTKPGAEPFALALCPAAVHAASSLEP